MCIHAQGADGIDGRQGPVGRPVSNITTPTIYSVYNPLLSNRGQEEILALRDPKDKPVNPVWLD